MYPWFGSLYCVIRVKTPTVEIDDRTIRVLSVTVHTHDPVTYCGRWCRFTKCVILYEKWWVLKYNIFDHKIWRHSKHLCTLGPKMDEEIWIISLGFIENNRLRVIFKVVVRTLNFVQYSVEGQTTGFFLPVPLIVVNPLHRSLYSVTREIRLGSFLTV